MKQVRLRKKKEEEIDDLRGNRISAIESIESIESRIGGEGD